MDTSRRVDLARADRVIDADFLIVGGGIQGVTLLHQLVEAGARRVLLATSEHLGAGETLHSHGYMHHGYMLPSAGKALARELAECGAWWWRRIEALGSTYRSQPQAYYGVSASSAAERMRIWDEFGAVYQPIDEPPEALRGGSAADGSTRLFAIRDRTVSMREILDDLASSLQDRIVRAELAAIGLDDAGTRVTQCHFRSGTDTSGFVVRPRVLLLATGRFAQPLLRSASTPTGARPLDERCREFNNIRFVPMLLVRGPGLPPVTAFFESHAVSVYTHPIAGTVEDESMWIVTYLRDHETDRGDFDDSRESRESLCGVAARQSVDRLCALVPAARERLHADLRFSGYLGGKIDHPGGGNARHVDDCGVENLRVAWPGLWSLSLANARDIVGDFGAGGPVSDAFEAGTAPLDLGDFGLRPGAPVGEERRLTEMQTWLPYAEFERTIRPHH